ncbi:hypothetical protein [Xanthomonas phage X1]|nr:hypothetical protein [Xanthomonas phage X1]
MNRTRQEKIEYLADALLEAQGKDQCDFSEEAKAILDEIFPPLPKVEYDKAYDRYYIPFTLTGAEVQTKGHGSSFRIHNGEDRRLSFQDYGGEHEFLTKLARQIRLEYGE